jgi:hypothetical protein
MLTTRHSGARSGFRGGLQTAARTVIGTAIAPLPDKLSREGIDRDEDKNEVLHADLTGRPFWCSSKQEAHCDRGPKARSRPQGRIGLLPS